MQSGALAAVVARAPFGSLVAEEAAVFAPIAAPLHESRLLVVNGWLIPAARGLAALVRVHRLHVRPSRYGRRSLRRADIGE